MDIRTLRQVVAIKTHGSFARAAEALGVSQPNLSKNVARLEDELKLKIFARTAKGSVLTPVGELIVERADDVITETRDLERDAALLAGGEMGFVRIGCTTSLGMTLLRPMMTRLAGEHPNVRIHAESAASARLLPLLESRDLDVVFTMQTPAAASASSYVVRPIIETQAIIVASPSHPLAGERGVSIARLAEFRCGGSQSKGSGNESLLGLESENLGMYTASHYEFLLPLVLSGDVVLVAPTFVVQPYLESGEMVIVDVQWRLDVRFHFVTTRVASFAPLIMEIAEHARAIGEELHDRWRGVSGQFTAG
jgi:DNA-binding transcriptional LysR family regulator